jgi:hypothetical protein
MIAPTTCLPACLHARARARTHAGPDEKAVYKSRGKVTNGGAVKGWGKQSH